MSDEHDHPEHEHEHFALGHFHHHQQEEGEVTLPRLSYQRPDELNDEFLMTTFDAIAEQWLLRGIEHGQVIRDRAKLYGAIDTPTNTTWEAAHQVQVWRPGANSPAYLWSLVLEYTAYTISTKEVGKAWPEVPGGGQIALALASYLSVTHGPDETF